MRGTSPSVPFVPVLPSDASRVYPPRQPGISGPGTYGHVPLESLAEEEYEPLMDEQRGVSGIHFLGEEPYGAPGPGVAALGRGGHACPRLLTAGLTFKLYNCSYIFSYSISVLIREAKCTGMRVSRDHVYWKQI